MGHLRSLQVLHLLAKLLDHAFELEPDIGQVDIIRFCGERIRFAVQFLRQKIKLTTYCSASGEKLLCLRYMGGEPVKLLADIGLGGEQDRLLVQAVGVETLICRE